MSKEVKKISFWFHPYKENDGMFAVEKADSNGVKKRYLKGVTSGLLEDGHGERMTKACIEDMQKQASDGEILLYEGQHGVTHTDDLGRLVKAEILPNYDWLTTYQLYDETDGFERGSRTLERVDKLWKQVNGLHPYEKKMSRGFSIEGIIPDDGILEMDAATGRRTQINKVALDGVLVTPRPAYNSSIASAIYKALGELPPNARRGVSENIRGSFMNKLAEEETKQSFYTKRFKLDDALNEQIEEIMTGDVYMKEKLDLLMEEYSKMLIQLVIEHQGAFRRTPNEQDVPEQGAIDLEKAQRLHVLKNMEDYIKAFIEAKVNKTKENKNANSCKRIKPRRKNIS